MALPVPWTWSIRFVSIDSTARWDASQPWLAPRFNIAKTAKKPVRILLFVHSVGSKQRYNEVTGARHHVTVHVDSEGAKGPRVGQAPFLLA